MEIEKFLKTVSEETEYKLGNPWRYSDKSLGVIVPILKIVQERKIEERIYVTLEEVKDDPKISFKDTGSIDRIIIESSLDKPIFIRSGTALKSVGTQPRAVEESIVVVPQEKKDWEEKDEIIIKAKQNVRVRCIYASKPIQRNEKFEYGGDVPFEVRRTLISRGSQSQTWASVGSSTNRFISMASHYASQTGSSFRASRDNLVGVMEEVDKFTSNVDEILKNVPLFEDQVGAVFLDMKDVVGLEMFDHPKSWEAIHKEVEKRLGESSTKEQESFYKPDYKAVKPLTLRFLKKLIEGEKTEVSHGITSTVSIKGDGVIGEATILDGKVIHLVGMRVDKEK